MTGEGAAPALMSHREHCHWLLVTEYIEVHAMQTGALRFVPLDRCRRAKILSVGLTQSLRDIVVICSDCVSFECRD